MSRLSTSAPPSVSRWSWTASANRSEQQPSLAAGGKVYDGDSEHNIDAYDAASQRRISRSITHQGGDFQAVALIDGVLYAGCHCNNEVHSDASNWTGDQSKVAVGASRTAGIGWSGAFEDRNSLVTGNSVSVRVGLGGSRNSIKQR